MIYTQDLIRTMPDRITLVGNGKMDNMADFINSSEYVIRFNGFIIEGYEKDVGEKIDAIFYNHPDIVKEVPEHYEKYRKQKPIFLHNDWNENSPQDLIYLSPGTSSIFQTTIDENTRLSAGAALSLSLALLFEKKLDLVGFDFFRTKHYYEPDRILSPTHVGDYESRMLRKISTITIH